MIKDDFRHEIGSSKVYDSATKESLVELFLALCELAASLTKLIMVVYPIGGIVESGALNKEMTDQTVEQIESCKSSLNTWFEKAAVEFPTLVGLGNTHASIVLYTNLMYIYYQ